MTTKKQRKRSKLNAYCELLNSADRLQDACMDFSEVMQSYGIINRADLDVLRDSVLDLYHDIKVYCEPYLKEAGLLWSELNDEEER